MSSTTTDKGSEAVSNVVNLTDAKPKAPRKPRTPAKPKRTPIKPKGAFKGNAISEAFNRGDAIKKIASDAGLSEEDTLARLDAYSAGFASVEAFVASKTEPKGRRVAAPKAAKKAKKPAAKTRHYKPEGSSNVGVRLIGITADGNAKDLGSWGGGPVPFADAVDAYIAATPDATFVDYLAVPQRNVWHISPK